MRGRESSYADIVIVGGGPAGSACALALRGSGLHVMVVDKSAFPRDKVCGDAVPGNATKALAHLSPDYLQEFSSVFPEKNIIHGVRLVSPNMKSCEVRFSRDGHVSKRFHFDAWLHSLMLRDSGVTFLKNTQIVSVAHSEQCIELKCEDGSAIRARLAIAADGAQSVLASRLGGFRPDPAHYCGAVRAYYKGVKDIRTDMLEVYFLQGYLPGYFWIFPLPGGEVNVGFGMLTKTISAKHVNLKKSVEQIITEFPGLKERFAGAERIGDIRGFGLPLGSQKRAISGDHFMLCGDAASLIDPFSGEGIGNAMWSGIFAAEQAKKCFASGNFSAAFLKPYDAAVYAKMEKSFRTSYFFQRLLKDRVRLINMLVSLAANNRFIRNWLHKIM